MLKGVDALLLYAELVQRLRLRVDVKLVAENQRFDMWDDMEREDEDEWDDEQLEGEEGEDEEGEERAGAEKREWNEKVQEKEKAEEEEEMEGEEEDELVDEPVRRTRAANVAERKEADAVYVSDVMQPVTATDFSVMEESARELPMAEIMPHFARFNRAVEWLNGDLHDSAEFTVSYQMFGNEPSSSWLYTEVALLVYVPRFRRRRVLAAAATSVSGGRGGAE